MAEVSLEALRRKFSTNFRRALMRSRGWDVEIGTQFMGKQRNSQRPVSTELPEVLHITWLNHSCHSYRLSLCRRESAIWKHIVLVMHAHWGFVDFCRCFEVIGQQRFLCSDGCFGSRRQSSTRTFVTACGIPSFHLETLLPNC